MGMKFYFIYFFRNSFLLGNLQLELKTRLNIQWSSSNNSLTFPPRLTEVQKRQKQSSGDVLLKSIEL